MLRSFEMHGEVADDRLPVWDELQQLSSEYEGRLS